MTPEEHIAKAESLLDMDGAWAHDWYSKAQMRATRALAHIELAKFKRDEEKS